MFKSEQVTPRMISLSWKYLNNYEQSSFSNYAETLRCSHGYIIEGYLMELKYSQWINSRKPSGKAETAKLQSRLEDMV